MKKKLLALLICVTVSVSMCACANPFTKDNADDGGWDNLVEDYVPDDLMTDIGTPVTDVGSITDADTTLTQPEEGEDGEEGDETTPDEEVVVDKSKWPFNRLHPELFQFRFDGTTAFIGDMGFTGEAIGTSGSGGSYTTDPDKSTVLESVLLPTDLLFKNTVPGYNLSNGPVANIVSYWNNDIELTVSVFDETKATAEMKKINYPGEFVSYELRSESATLDMEHIESAEVILFDYTLRSNQTEGTGVAMLSVKLDNGSYIIVRNAFNDVRVLATDLVALLANNTEWVENG